MKKLVMKFIFWFVTSQDVKDYLKESEWDKTIKFFTEDNSWDTLSLIDDDEIDNYIEVKTA